MPTSRNLVNTTQILESDVIVSNGTQSIGIRPLGTPHENYLIEIVFSIGEADKPTTITSAALPDGNFRVTINN
jgi:hypothetical protein